jgi:hypothetical protein
LAKEGIVVKHEVLGETIIEGTAEEIRAAWSKTPVEERHKFWETEEYTAHILDDPAQVQACIDAKKAKPGRLQ